MTPQPSLARRAVKAHPRHPLADRATTNHLRRQWLRAVALLGNKWILARRGA